MFALFKSAETKQREQNLKIVIASVRQHISEASAEIQHIERTMDQQLRNQAASILFNTVIYCDRSMNAVEAKTARVTKLLEANRLQRALGMMLGTRLVIAGVLLAELSGKEWVEASFVFAALEGMLRGFMERNGVDPWPVVYAYDGLFERYRHEYIAHEDAKDPKATAD